MATKGCFCLYLRIASRDAQALEAQKEQLRQWAIKRGYTIAGDDLQADPRRNMSHGNNTDVICLNDGFTSYLFATRFRA